MTKTFKCGHKKTKSNVSHGQCLTCKLDYNLKWHRRKYKEDSDFRDKHRQSSAKGMRKQREKEWAKMGMTRSEIMRRITSVSKLETLAAPLCRQLAGCRLVHQPKGILGRPDFANKSKRVAVFVDGCYWHGHLCRHHGPPKTNTAFWVDKVAHNQARDAYVTLMLEASGWTVLRIPECVVRDHLRGARRERRASV